MVTDNRITKEDINDVDFVDAEELLSDGYTIYKTSALVSTTTGTRVVVIIPSTAYDGLINVDKPVEVDDIVIISGNAAAGAYTVESITNGTDFVVAESIPSSVGGSVDFIYPAGAKKVGFDSSNTVFITSDTVQGALEDLDGFVSGSGKYRQTIWAEENGPIADNQFEWSFGNGAVGDIGIPVFEDCEIVGMVYNAEIAGDATTEVEVRVNGLSVSRSIVPGNGVQSATISFTAVAVSAGDAVGFFTLFGGGASDVRVGAVIEYDISVITLDGYVGLTADEHETLDTITHELVETSFTNATYGGPGNRLTNVTDYTDGTLTVKIREVDFTYIGPRVSQIDSIQYDGNGIELYRIVELPVYAGPFTNRILTITRTRVG